MEGPGGQRVLLRMTWGSTARDATALNLTMPNDQTQSRTQQLVSVGGDEDSATPTLSAQSGAPCQELGAKPPFKGSQSPPRALLCPGCGHRKIHFPCALARWLWNGRRWHQLSKARTVCQLGGRVTMRTGGCADTLGSGFILLRAGPAESLLDVAMPHSR